MVTPGFGHPYNFFQYFQYFQIYNFFQYYQKTTVLFLNRGSNKLYSSHQEKKQSAIMWNTWVLWIFIVLHASNFIIVTEDNSRQSQVYDSYIAKVGAVSSIRNDVLTLYYK